MIAVADAPLLDGTRCLIMGGGGFLGVHLANALARQGAVVRAFGRLPVDPQDLDERVHWSSGRFEDPAAVAEAAQGQEIAFHLLSSSVPGSPGQSPASDLETNVLGTLRFLDICNTAAIRRVVFASSGGTVYGPAGSRPIPETAATHPISAYGVGKLAIEKYLGLYHHLYGLEYVALRIANAYGPRQSVLKRQGVVAAMLDHALSGKPLEIWGNGEVIRDFIHIDDVASAFLWAATYDGPHRVMNVGSGIGLSINQVASDIQVVTGVPDLPRHYRAGRTADVPANILDISLITQETPWRPRRGWIDGLQNTAQWMAAKRRIPLSSASGHRNSAGAG
ncbi:NAD-dependent epimerase/dehydratase family protein [Bosea sp. AS-1]|uniref:NAD-dependent epimerase/dehydratase family protein n=1 Tax=Bosea sp. AS-1 TaxID=2015316 RepID=UPI000B76EED8|nr:NAD-dependent epimerase/dehydratase family protein [Bosea sp. AS-1]